MSAAELISTTLSRRRPAIVLTIAGSDSGGAAGLQADLHTFATLGVYGLSVVTVVTAQNSEQVTAVHPIPPDVVAAQLDAVFSDYGATAVKTGFIGRLDLIHLIAAKLREYEPRFIVVDPVLVNHRGEAMFAPEVTTAYIHQLLPLADLVTPNRMEAALLTGMPVTTIAEMETAVYHLHALGPRHVLIKSGIDNGDMVDMYFDGRHLTLLRAARIDTRNTHGSGDTLSAAVGALLAKGEKMETAVRQAHQFTQRAIKKGSGWQLGRGHGPVIQW